MKSLDVAVLDYDVLSECYDELYGGEQRSKYRAAVDRVRPDEASRVLDAGCGTGLFLRYLREVGCFCEYVGVDVSQGMLRRAVEKLDMLSHLVMADANHLPFREDTFTHVYSFTTIHHLDARRFLDEALRVSSRSVVITQHKRLSPRLEMEACETEETVDQLVVLQDKPPVLRSSPDGRGSDSLSRGGQAR
ncbi:MAG: class I SAM-dependent methyltransferase [Candidatus Caldarchaeum sp.]